eukprot:5874393-Pleurochrysis_carterae.AAC.1
MTKSRGQSSNCARDTRRDTCPRNPCSSTTKCLYYVQTTATTTNHSTWAWTGWDRISNGSRWTTCASLRSTKDGYKECPQEDIRRRCSRTSSTQS